MFNKKRLFLTLSFVFSLINLCFASEDVLSQEDSSSQIQLDLEDKINNFLKNLKEDLRQEQEKLEAFKESFLVILDTFSNLELSKDEKINLIRERTKDIVLSAESFQLSLKFKEELTEKIVSLSEQMIVFIENEEIDLDRLSQNVSYIIQTLEELTSMLQNQSSFSDKENDDDLQTKGVAYIKTKEAVKEKPKTKSKEKIIRRGVTLAAVQQKEESKSKKTIKKVEKTAKKIGDATVKALVELGDFRLGGYPAAFLSKVFKNY